MSIAPGTTLATPQAGALSTAPEHRTEGFPERCIHHVNDRLDNRPRLTASTYCSAWWLPGGHAQTIVPALAGRRARVAYTRERWPAQDASGTPDGDFIDVDFLPWIDGAPLVVMFHGLEGGSQSHYALALMRALAARGWNGCVPHFRGCSGELNLLPRAYHSGDSMEIDWIIRRLAARLAALTGASPLTGAPPLARAPTHTAAGHAAAAPPPRPPRLYAAGVSLGGNALAKWAGEQGNAAKALVGAICSVSAPLDLTAAGHALGRGLNMIYTRMFLASLKQKGAAKLAQHPGLFDGAALWRARDLYDFDNLVTAPLHGFRNTEDYWARASAKPWLRHIAVPALILNARNDPFLPAAALPGAADVSAQVTLEQPTHGGHVGFVHGHLPPGNIGWLPKRLLDFFSLHP